MLPSRTWPTGQAVSRTIITKSYPFPVYPGFFIPGKVGKTMYETTEYPQPIRPDAQALKVLETYSSGVFIPLLQAMVSGFFAAITAAGVAVSFKIPEPAGVAMTAAGVVSAVWWWTSQSKWQSTRQYAVYGPPVANPAQLQPVEAQPAQVVKVEVSQDAGRRMSFYDLPATPAQLATLAAGVLAGRGLAVNSWTGSGQPFTRPEYDRLRSIMLKAGWIRELDKRGSVTITDAGKAVFRHLANLAVKA